MEESRMKIGILTYHSAPNFGANLQALSTVGFLKKRGMDPVIINWVPENFEVLHQKRVSEEQYNTHCKFAKMYLPQTGLCRSENDVLDAIEGHHLDGIIIGSDAVLCHIPLSRRRVFSIRKMKYVNVEVSEDREFPNPYWAYFVPKLRRNIPVVGFSVSSQNMPYFALNEQEINGIQDSLKNFTYITVRDEWTQKMINYFLGDGLSIPITPDPVFAFNENNFIPVIEKEELLRKYNLPYDYVLISFHTMFGITQNWIKKIECLFKKKGMTCVALPMPDGIRSMGLKYVITTPLETLDWYYLIKYSKGYIGERMHPIIVSIHNHVPFYSFDGNGTYYDTIIPFYRKYIRSSSKIYDLLKNADLLENTCSYYMMSLKKRSPEYIYERIIEFDTDKEKKYSDYCLSEYKRAMEKVIKLLLGEGERIK
jgi:hypothetical protein